MAEKAGTIRPGELFVWTDIDPEFEEDFNRWYDSEHMAERVDIDGFVWARRYRSESHPRRYLALYRTTSLGTFTSAAYRQAFAQQTSWSLANFARMRDSVRRVCTVAAVAGEGTGGAVALLRLGAASPPDAVLGEALAALDAVHGVLGAHVLVPDPELSTPLPSESATERALETMAVIEATGEKAAGNAARRLAESLGVAADRIATFSLLWELRADDRRK